MDKRYQHLYNKTDRKNRGRNKGSNHARNRIVLYKKQRVLARLALGTLFIFVLIVVLCSLVHLIKNAVKRQKDEEPTQEILEVPPLTGVADRFTELPITEDYLSINEYSRPGLALSSNPEYIVIHYTANPGSSAKQNRDYFENLKDTHQTYASAQFVIGLQGEIEQCVPCNEIAYCSNSLNDNCISIEMCHPDEEGNFNDATYNNCVSLVAHLMNYYHLDMDHLIRHYDVTGKNCPKYFVEHPDRWEVFKDFVAEYREKYKDTDYYIDSEEGETGSE